jgi:hypothetical protein
MNPLQVPKTINHSRRVARERARVTSAWTRCVKSRLYALSPGLAIPITLALPPMQISSLLTYRSFVTRILKDRMDELLL